jgi:dephospho-CoA kinase
VKGDTNSDLSNAGAPRGTLRIGLTGPIGCGKSTVAGWLAEFGATVIDADQVAREVTSPGSEELAAIVDAFGSEVLRGNGTLDRARLGRIVFADPEALQRLEAIIHPAVRPRILAAIESAERSGAPAVVVEAIKLVEGGLAELCDEVWLVSCDPDTQRARLTARARERARSGGPAGRRAARPRDDDDADASARIAAQGQLVERLTPFATRVIDTSGSVAESRSRVQAAWAR